MKARTIQGGPFVVRAVVTGGHGFIGSHIVDGLVRRGFEVGVVDIAPPSSAWKVPAGVSWAQLDVASAEAEEWIAGFRPRTVYHLAAQVLVPSSVLMPVEDARVNILGLLRILEGARRGGAEKVVYSSSAAVYGEGNGPLPLVETLPAAPIAPYGVAKAAGEMYLQSYRVLHGLQYASLRYANVYGPRQGMGGEGGVVAIFCAAAAGDRPIRLFGDGGHTRDYVYVEDVATANLAAADYPGSLVCNIGTGLQTSNAELIELLRRVAKKDIAVLREPERPGDIRHSALSPDRCREALGFAPKTRLPEGLAATYEWFRSRNDLD